MEQKFVGRWLVLISLFLALLVAGATGFLLFFVGWEAAPTDLVYIPFIWLVFFLPISAFIFILFLLSLIVSPTIAHGKFVKITWTYFLSVAILSSALFILSDDNGEIVSLIESTPIGCKMIQDGSSCYRRLAEETNNITYCGYAYDYDQRFECYTHFAEQGGNASLCPQEDTYCTKLMNAAEKKWSVILCERTEKYSRAECFENLVKKTGDLTLCRKSITNPEQGVCANWREKIYTATQVKIESLPLTRTVLDPNMIGSEIELARVRITATGGDAEIQGLFFTDYATNIKDVEKISSIHLFAERELDLGVWMTPKVRSTFFESKTVQYELMLDPQHPLIIANNESWTLSLRGTIGDYQKGTGYYGGAIHLIPNAVVGHWSMDAVPTEFNSEHATQINISSLHEESR